jgi:hypothetical protein
LEKQLRNRDRDCGRKRRNVTKRKAHE